MAGSALVAAPGAVEAFDPEGIPVYLSEIHYDNDGSDVDEGVEITGPAGTDLTGWTIVRYNGNGGVTYGTSTLSGAIPDLDGTSGVVVQTYPANGLQNGGSPAAPEPDGIALVDDEGTVVQFLSYEGTLTATNGPAIGLTSTDIGVFEPSDTPIGQSLQRVDDDWIGPVAASFGSLNTAPPPPVRECALAPEVTLISEVQGATDVSPCLDEADVLVEGVVVADFEGPQPQLRGFYVQEEDLDADADPATSEGIFVFTNAADEVGLGDVVQVTGTVSEFEEQTQLSSATISITTPGDGVTTPGVTPTEVTLPVADADSLEAVEGMLVTFPQALTATEYFQLGRFGQVVVSSDGRLDNPTAVAEPGPAAQAVQAANNLNRLIIDDTTNDQNPATIIYGGNGAPLSADNPLRGGDTTTGATGVMTYTWAGNSASGNAYRLRPATEPIEFVTANPRPTEAPAVGGGLKAASFNVLNYFLTLDDGGNDCGPVANRQECRGAEDVEEFERQRTKMLAALTKIDADVVGLMEIENSELAGGGTVDVLGDIVAGLNDIEGEGAWDYVDAGLIGTDVIKVGIIYRTAAVAQVGDFAVLDSSVDPQFIDTLNRPALAASFIDKATGGTMTVVVNHFKSKGCGGATGLDADQGDGQGCWNPARTAAAEALVDWLDTSPTGLDDPDTLVLGDLNSYAKEDPIDVLIVADYVDLAPEYSDDPYGYVFDGQWGYLDYALASSSLVAQVTGAADYHINSDEVPVLDYNTNFKTPAQIDDYYAPDEFRTSDHDPVLVGLDLTGPDVELGTVSISGVTVDESDGTATLTVERSGADDLVGAEVSYQTVDGTALDGSDYAATTGTLTWEPGDSVAKTITVDIIDDTAVEDSETFEVELFDPVTTAIATDSATVTITDGDVAPAEGTVSISDVTVDESDGTATLTVTRTGADDSLSASVDYRTVDGSALAGPDYTSTTGTLTWEPGDSTAQTITVGIVDDDVVEGTETFLVELIDPVTTAIATPSATVTITDGDVAVVQPAVSTVERGRFVDTRADGVTIDGLEQAGGALTASSVTEFQIAGRGPVPVGADAVVMYVTAVRTTATGFVTVFPCTDAVPTVSSVNYTAGVNVGNEIFAPLSDDGTICVLSSTDIQFTVDVAGYVDEDSSTVALAPNRFLDTRAAGVTVDGEFVGAGRAAGQQRVQITGRGDVPGDAAAVIVNVAAVNPGDKGFVTVHPCIESPTTSSL
ncbi:MAG: ExeM/NucH family extracellular endonuclease, partial [Ilumatobacter sp.]